MFLSVFCLYCLLQLLNYCKVFADDDPFHRFIVEEGFKPAIFGSYVYDPISQKFDTYKKHDNVSQIVNSSYVLSTAIGSIMEETTTTDTTDAVYRHHVTIVPPPPTLWWARKLTKNITRHPRFQVL